MNKHRQLLIALVTGALLTVALVAFQIWHSRQESVRAAEETTRNYGAILEARLDATLRRVEGDIRDLTSRVPIAALSKQSASRYIREIDANLDLHAVDFPEMSGIRIFDADGDLLYSSDHGNVAAINNADRPHFREARDGPPDRLVVSEVFVARTTGTTTLAFGKALWDKQNNFRGVLTVTLDLKHFQRLFESLKLSDRSSIAIYRSDKFTQVIRWPERSDGQPNIQLPQSSPIRSALSSGTREGTLAFASSIEGVERIYSYHALEHYPFFIVVGLSHDQVLSTWRTRSQIIALSVLMVLALLAVLLSRLLHAQKARNLLAAIVENSNDAIYSRAFDDTILTWNTGAARMLGYSATEVIGKPATILAPPGRPNNLIRNNERLLRGEVVSHETDRKARDGRIVPVLASYSPIRNGAGTITGASIILQDITDRRKAEAEVRKNATFRELLLEAIPLPVFYKDAAGSYTGCNHAFAQFIGKSRDEIIGRTVLEVSPQSFANTYQDKDSNLLEGQVNSQVYEGHVRHGDGSTRDVIFHKARIADDSGNPTGIIGVITDITEIRQVQAMRDQLEAQLRESQKMQAIGTLAGGIAHDFNNIIATVLGNAELARQDVAGNKRALESLTEIAKAARRGREVVRQILSFSRRQPPERKPIAITPIIEESARLLRATMPARVELKLRCAPDVPVVNADITQIEQVIINLATNAMQAIGGVPGRIEIGLDTVLLDAQLIMAHPALRELPPGTAGPPVRLVRLVMKDTGPGMDDDTLARIFEPFFTTKAVDEGTGLGLAVVHGIVEAHEGVIEVTSQPGEGASFTIFLPAAEMTGCPETSNRNEESQAGSLDGCILYLDDDEALVSLMKRLLERRGYHVSDHISQEAALAALRADPMAFDLVVTDYNMPGMSGLDVAREVKAIRADLPVAIASGFIDEDLRAQAGAVGVIEVIFKADAVEDFCNVVQRLIEAAEKTS